jgi:hypothetical protein
MQHQYIEANDIVSEYLAAEWKLEGLPWEDALGLIRCS